MAKTFFLEKLRCVPNAYRPAAFWFLNHFLREDELRRQVREMADKGLGGIILHARNGLRSGYLNGEWKKALSWCLDEAQKHGMDAWLYDELNYPTGPAGGRMFDFLPDSRMKSLELVQSAKIKPGRSFRIKKNLHAIKYILSVAPDGAVDPGIDTRGIVM